MKKYIFTLLLFLAVNQLFAQINLEKELPLDPRVRTGILKNGMKYYIRYNNYPKGYADFQIFHSVGAMQEEDHQNGLAHFLEHLAFNGLKHFPGKSMMEYMEKIGVKFGANLNAATSLDYTQYMINSVPVTREGILDTCLLVLHDWSGFILCEQNEIDSERGVIQEERRSRGGIGYRMSEAVVPAIYKGSKYAVRNVIGNVEVIDTFKRADLLSFYRKWYYPQFQAVSVVGDIDVDKIEAKIKKLFSDIPCSPTPLAKEEYKIPDNKELIYVAYDDPEATGNSIEILFKRNSIKDSFNNIGKYYVMGYKRHLVTSMMNSRVNDILRNGDYSATSLDFSYSKLAGNKDVFSISTETKQGEQHILPAYKMLLEEGERFKRFGFTEQEFERIKSSALRGLENTLSEKDKKENGSFSKKHLGNFISNQPILDIEYYCNLLKQTLASFSLEEANTIAKEFFTKENQIAVITGNTSDKKGFPSKNYMIQSLQDMPSMTIEPFKDKVLPKSLICKDPVPGKLISKKPMKYGIEEWRFTNGAKVYVLPTNHKKDDIQFAGYQWGGRSLVDDKDFFSAGLISSAMNCSGVGNFNATDLKQMLSGKIVYVTPLFNEYYHGLDCATTPTDLEAMLQVIYLQLAQPRFEKESFDIYKSKMKENLISRKKDPFSFLMDSVTIIRENNHVHASNLILNPADVDKVSLDRIKELYPQFFGNPADFQWFMTGAIDTAVVRPLLEKYIGSLKGNGQTWKWKDTGKRPPVGKYVSDFKRKMETPKSTTFIEYTSPTCKYSYELSTKMRLLQGILEIRFNELIREEKSGTYSVDIEGSLSRMPVPIMRVIVSFDSKPQMMDELKKVVFTEMERIAKEGIDKDAMEKSREYMLKILDQNKLNNNYWQGVMIGYIRNGEDYQDRSLDIVKGITAVELQNLVKQLVSESNIVDITMRPE